MMTSGRMVLPYVVPGPEVARPPWAMPLLVKTSYHKAARRAGWTLDDYPTPGRRTSYTDHAPFAFVAGWRYLSI